VHGKLAKRFIRSSLHEPWRSKSAERRLWMSRFRRRRTRNRAKSSVSQER